MLKNRRNVGEIGCLREMNRGCGDTKMREIKGGDVGCMIVNIGVGLGCVFRCGFFWK